MSIASRLKTYLYNSRVDFDLLSHPPTATTLEAARKAEVPAHATAKSVVVHHIDGYAMAVLPANRNVNLSALQDLMHYRLGLARETDLAELFDDCVLGAIPPIGPLYGLPTLVDHELEESDDIWFEGGDHETLVQVSQGGFQRMMRDVEHADFSCRGAH